MKRSEIKFDSIENELALTNVATTKLEKDVLDYEFVPITPEERNGMHLIFSPEKISINWQTLISKEKLPKTVENPTGIDVDTLVFGDVGICEMFTSQPYEKVGVDTSFKYYAIIKNKIIKIEISSVEAIVRYEEQGEPSFYGRFISETVDFGRLYSFVIMTSDESIPNKVKVHSVTEEEFEINSTANELKLFWQGKEFSGYTDEYELNKSETLLIEIEGDSQYLLSSWDHSKGMCDHFFRLFLLSDGKLKEISLNGYGCEI
ncbi:MAG: hypothetical protein JEZ09_11505 [Salinivirgaceae bacterium]|nr:hypothetical protein [Salinivirgaceae bacterium]